jgi:hypothetical protein
VTAPADPQPPRGREDTRIQAYAVHPRAQRLDLLVDWSSGQRLRAIRLRRGAGGVLVARVVLTQHQAEDLRVGCVSVRWPVRAGTVVRDRARRARLPSAARSRRVRRALRRDCRGARVVPPNAVVDAPIAPGRYPPPRGA